jgi:hypothetical protein
MSRNHRIKEIWDVHRRHHVPLSITVPFLLKLEGWEIGETAQAAGYTRAYLHLVLVRGLEPPHRLRQTITKRLGIDPWEAAGDVPRGTQRRVSNDSD